MKTLEERIQLLEDLEAIRTLQRTYETDIDQGYANKTIKWSTMNTYFTEDGIFEIPALQVRAQGAEMINGTFKFLSDNNVFFYHSLTNPVINVNGDTATGTWLLTTSNIAKEGDKMALVFGNYTAEYARTAAGWKIKILSLNLAGSL